MEQNQQLLEQIQQKFLLKQMPAKEFSPLVLAYIGNLENTLVMLPASVMLLTGMWSHLFQEYQAIKSFESYEMFI